MATSVIAVSGLVATGGAGQINLEWSYSDPINGAIPNIALDAVEVHAADTNDRAGASQVAEGVVSAIHSGLPRAAVRYYWIRARNKLGNYGDWYPSGATSGVSGTELIGGLTVPEVTSLTASGGVGLNSLSWELNDPNSNGLGDLALDVVEVHAAATNDRAGATKVAEGKTFSIDNGLSRGETRYYWVRPRHVNGTNGSFYPASSTGGISATELSGNVLLAGDGFWELPSGLIFEWGSDTSNAVTAIGDIVTQRLTNTGTILHWGAIPVDATFSTTETFTIEFNSFGSVGGNLRVDYRTMKATDGGAVELAPGLTISWFLIGVN